MTADPIATIRDALKPRLCPFCGAAPVIKTVFDAGDYFVTCDCGSFLYVYKEEEDAIAAWNKRTPPLPRDVRAALEYVVSHWLFSSSSFPLGSRKDYSDRMCEIRDWLDAIDQGEPQP